MMAELRVEMVSRKGRHVVTNDGQVFPITNFYDCWGDEVDDPDEAVSCAAGKGDTWFTVDLTKFVPRTWH
jgi:hypothetical protein